MTRPVALAVLAVALALPDHASGENRRLTLDDVRSLVRLSDPQIYVSATKREPIRITESATGIRFFAWKPDGAAIAYVATDERPTRTGPARHDDTFTVASDHYQTTAAPLPSHLWLVPAAVGPAGRRTARRLTSGTWSLATALTSSPLSWSADGRTIACVRFPSGSPGDSDQGTVTLLDVAAGTGPRPLTGRTLREDWWPDGSSLLISGTDGTRGALWRQALGGAARKVDLGAVASFEGVSIARTGALALVGNERAWPAEVYVLNADDPPRRLTDFNAPIAQIPLGRNERFTVTSPDGLVGDGVVTYPPSFDPRRPHPLVLVIHGGPTASSTEGFSALVQLLAARGWIVYQPNYSPADPVRQLERDRRWVEWLARWLQ